MARFIVGILLVAAVFAVAQHQHHDMSSMPQQQVQAPDAMDPAMPAMQHRHNDMGPHMKLTGMRPVKADDQQRADEIVKSARAVMEHYADYREAMADGYRIFLPNLPQKMYHFTNYRYAIEAAFGFNPNTLRHCCTKRTGRAGSSSG